MSPSNDDKQPWWKDLVTGIGMLGAHYLMGNVIPGGAGVPRFGKGGVVRKPTLAIVGEEGPEKISPIGKKRRFYGENE